MSEIHRAQTPFGTDDRSYNATIRATTCKYYHPYTNIQAQNGTSVATATQLSDQNVQYVDLVTVVASEIKLIISHHPVGNLAKQLLNLAIAYSTSDSSGASLELTHS